MLAGTGLATGRSTDRTAPAPTRAQLCAVARDAAQWVPAEHQGTPSMHEQADAVCSGESTAMPTAAPVQAQAASVAGCSLPDGRARRARRSAPAPRRPVPYFAPRSGALPATGRPVVGGVRLPAGTRCGPFWATDAGVEDAFRLARRLASAFPRTGLWPIVWSWPDERPDGYVAGESAAGRPGSAEALLRRSWRANGLGERGPFPGLAAPAAGAASGGAFGRAVEESLVEQPPAGGWVVLLVPANRPADVHRALALETTEHFTAAELGAVLRSWEERFGAVVSVLTPSTLELSVAAPPREGGQARRLAAEHAAFAPEDEATWDLGARARGLRSARSWAFGWPD